MARPYWNCAGGGRTGRRTSTPPRRKRAAGTPAWYFDPVELLERLAALTPRPRVNLVLYHGVLAPRAAWRKRIVPPRISAEGEIGKGGPTGSADDRGSRRARPLNRGWADLMQRSFGFDVLAWPRCPGRLKLVALIREPAVILRILRHLRLPEDLPAMRPARDPPLPFDGNDLPPSDD